MTYDRDGILANILEPDELESTGTHAVDTLHLVCADDDVLQSSASTEDEHGIIATYNLRKSSDTILSKIGLHTTLAFTTGTSATVVLDPTSIKDLASSNLNRSIAGDLVGVGGETTLVSVAGQGRRDESRSKSQLGEHFDG